MAAPGIMEKRLRRDPPVKPVVRGRPMATFVSRIHVLRIPSVDLSRHFVNFSFVSVNLASPAVKLEFLVFSAGSFPNQLAAHYPSVMFARLPDVLQKCPRWFVATENIVSFHLGR